MDKVPLIQDIGLMVAAHKPNSFLSGIMWNFLGQILPGLLMLVCIPIIISHLGTERFGILSLAWGLFGYLSLLDFGMSRSLTHAVSTKLASEKTLEINMDISTAVIVLLGLGLAIGGAVELAKGPLVSRLLNGSTIPAEELFSTMTWIAVAIPFTLVSIGLKGAIEGFGRFDYANYIKTPLALATYGLPALSAIFFARVDYGILCLAISRALSVALYLVVIWKISHGFNFRHFSKRSFRELFSYGGWLAISSILSPIMYQIDRFFVGAVVGAAAVTFYTAPLELVTKLWFVPTAVLSVMFPAMASLKIRNSSEAALTYHKSIKMTMAPIVLVVMTFLLFPHEILSKWINPEFALKTQLVFQILSVGILINCLAQGSFTFIQSWGRPDITAKFHLIQLPIFVVFFYFCVSKYDIVGAAMAWTGRVILDSFMLGFYAPRLAKWSATNRLNLILTVFGLLGLWVGASASLAVRLGVGAAFVLFFVATVGLSKYFLQERHEFAILLQRLKKGWARPR